MGQIFSNKLQHGVAIGAQPNFVNVINKIIDILENIEGIGDVTIHKDGIDWRIARADKDPSYTDFTQTNVDPPGTPPGYVQETLNLVTDSGIVTRTLLVRKADMATIVTFYPSQNRKLLQINSAGKVAVDYGYLAG